MKLRVKTTSFETFIPVALCIYIFFPFFSLKNIIFIVLLAILLVIGISKNGLYSKHYGTVGLFFLIVIYSSFVGFLNGLNFEGKNEIESFVIATILILLLIMCRLDLTKTKIIMSVFSAIFLLATYCQLLHIGVFDGLAKIMLSESAYRQNQLLDSWGELCGLTSTNFENAFFISVFGGFCWVRIRNSTSRIALYTVLYLISLGAIFLTGKKSIILANIVIVILCQMIVSDKEAVKSGIRKYGVIVLSTVVAIVFLESKYGMFSKIFREVSLSSDVSSGRLDMYELVLKNINSNMIFGYGLGSVYSIYSQGLHNIYLQIIYEMGFVGLSLFLLLFIYSFLITLHHVKTKSIYRDELLFSLYMQLIFLIYGFFGNPLYYRSTLIMYSIMISYTPISHIMQEINEKPR